MAAQFPSREMVLYIWPGSWDLPSIDPSCLASVLYLQYAIPGKFSIIESNNPDLAPTGQFPFLIHEQRTISTFLLIAKYVAGLKDVSTTDTSLDRTEKSQKIAWCAHAEANLGDLVYNMLYSQHRNWTGLTQPMLTSILPVPQRYYVPGRIRACYRPRLEAAGLWNLPDVEKEKTTPFGGLSKPKKEETNTRVYLQAFEREKVLEKARISLDIYTRLLGSKEFFYSARLTTLDIVVTSHILLLLNPPYPDPLLQTLINDSYPTLSSHARKVYAQLLNPEPPTSLPVTPRFSWASLIPWPPTTRKQIKKSQEDIHYDRMRWGFYGLALGSLIAYVVVVWGSSIKQLSAMKVGELEKAEAEVDDSEIDSEGVDI